MKRANHPRCPDCGEVLPGNAVLGLCPRCVLLQSTQVDALPPEATGEESKLSSGPPGSIRHVFGNYELLEEIGRGGMGVVYRARQRELNRVVALKMVMPELLCSRSHIQRFRLEAETAARLEHPHLLPIYEVGDDSGQPYYAMKLVEGLSLAKRLKEVCLPALGDATTSSSKKTAGRQHRIAGLMHKIASAVAHAHERGVLHRDLKPANVLMDESGEPFVADFGLAKLFEQDAHLTQSLAIVGTPAYAAPEQVEDTGRQLTTAADVYSLGAILYALMTGRAPHEGASTLAILRQVKEEAVKPPHAVVLNVNRDLETICLKCLEKDSLRRYQTAGELADELKRFLSGEPITARPVTTPERLWRWSCRKPALASALSAVVVVFLAGVIGVLIQWQRAEANAEARQEEIYYRSIRMADSSLKQGDVDSALRELVSCPEEYRHWEWGRLAYLCFQDVLSVEAHTNITLSMLELGWDLNGVTRKVAFNPSGKRLVTLGRDGVLKIWDTKTGGLVTVIGGEDEGTVSFAHNPKGEHLAISSTVGQVKILSTADWRPVATFSGLSTNLSHVVFHPDGEKLAVSDLQGPVVLYHVESAQLVGSFDTPVRPIDRVAFTSNGGGLLVGNQSRIAVLDADSGTVARILEMADGESGRVFSGPTGEAYVTISQPGQVVLHPAGGEAKLLTNLRGSQPDWIQRVVFSPDGSRFCTGGDLGTAGVYRARDGEQLFTMPDRVNQAAFSQNGDLLTTLGLENVVRIWEVKSGRELKVLKGHQTVVTRLAFSPDGARIATGDLGGVVKLWSTRPGREVLEGDAWIWGLAVSPDGRLIAASPFAEKLQIWAAESGKRLHQLHTPFQYINAARFSPDGTRIATAGSDNTARIWDFRTDACLLKLSGHERSLWDLEYSPDGQLLATCGADGTARVWDSVTGQELQVLDHGTNDVIEVSFDPESRWLATSGGHGIVVWDIRSGRQVVAMGRSGPGEASISFYRSGDRLLTLGWDDTVRIFDARNGHELAAWKASGIAHVPGASPDEERLVMGVSNAHAFGYGTDRARAELMAMETGRSILLLEGHEEPFNEMVFSPDGRRIISSSFDFTIRQWETFPWQNREFPGSTTDPLAERLRRYADTYWRERLEAETLAPEEPSEGKGSSDQDVDRSYWPDRDPGATANEIDLTECFNGILTAPFYPFFGWAGSDNDLAELGHGLITLENIAFDIRGVIQLRRTEPVGGVWRQHWDRMPTAVEDIRIGRTFDRMHVILATDQGEGEGAEVGRLVWHYADGREEVCKILYGEDVRAWWEKANDASDIENGKVAWRGTNPNAVEQGATLRLYRRTWKNPRPQMAVETLDFTSDMSRAAPFVIAISVE